MAARKRNFATAATPATAEVETSSPPRKAARRSSRQSTKVLKPAKAVEREAQVEMEAEAQVKVQEEEEEEAEMEATENHDDDAVERGPRRAPPINSDFLPLPWKGRLGYACLNTYLRSAKTPVFSSRTCRLASIIENRHPLCDPTQPPHATKNRPDRTKPASVERGLAFVQALGLANARDIVKMIEWNDRYGIKFMRLSSEMFPFASHSEHGYPLAPFAAEALAEAGRTAARLGHRLTTHPGQYTQIASPRAEVVAAAVRDLVYHDEMLSLLRLPPDLDRDAVMVLHMGGTFGDRRATLQRFRENYKRLPEGVRRRLVLENDDVSWGVLDLLPVCEELDIPLVLDFHHHNIIFFDSDDSSSSKPAALREGTRDIVGLFDRIERTWTRKGIKQKMHYSEPTAEAITPRDRRKHSARVRVLPPCKPDMDLMIEAKDKEQAVFELMRTYRLPGWDLFNDVVPFERDDEGGVDAGELAMGGPERRVYWPGGMEEWLRPRKKVKKAKKEGEEEGGEEEEGEKKTNGKKTSRAKKTSRVKKDE